MKIEEHARRLLDRIGVLGHPSDLDLLIFFARHPRSLLASEHLATLLPSPPCPLYCGDASPAAAPGLPPPTLRRIGRFDMTEIPIWLT